LQLPALAFGIPACLLTLFISLELLPYAARAFRDLVFQMTREKALASLQEGTFNNEFEGLSLYFTRLAPDGALREIMLEDRRNPPERRLVLAREGRVTFDTEELRMNLRLREGTIHIARPDSPTLYRLLSFETYDLRFDVGGRLGALAGRGRDRKELTVAELVRDARRQRAQRASDAKWWVEIHRRLAIPVSCLLFPVIGSALGLRIRRAGRMTSIVLGLAIGLGYYALLAGGEDLGTRERLAPVWAMWLPDAVLAATGAWLLLLGAREGQHRPLLWFRRWEAGRLGRQASGAPGA
jgi:lipopolysaccharide export LptBFGC system permease protein LptF